MCCFSSLIREILKLKPEFSLISTAFEREKSNIAEPIIHDYSPRAIPPINVLENVS